MNKSSADSRPGVDRHLAELSGSYAGQSASILAGILESVDDLFAAVDADLRFVAFNSAFRRECAEFYGHAPALGRSLREELAGYPEQQVLSDLAQRAFNGEAFALVHEFVDLRKQHRFYHINITPVPDTDGKAVMAALVARDVSARMKVDENLRRELDELRATVTELNAQLKDWRQRERSAENLSGQYRAVFEQGAVGIAVTATDGRILQVNDWFCNMIGYPREELLQLRIHDITHPEDVDVDLMMDGKMLAGVISSYTLEKRFYRKDGRLIWGALSASAKRNGDGKAQHFMYVIADITRRKEMEQRLTDAHFRLKIAAEIGRLGFWEHDVVTQESYFSPEWKEQAGYLEGEMPSTLEEWSSRIHPDDSARVLDGLQRFIEQPKGELQFEYRFRHRDGSFRWFLSRVIALADPAGKTRKIVGVRLDITDRKEIESAIRHEGQHDTLTGLPNRRLLYEYAGHVLAAARRGGTHGAIVFIDLDHFKEINDTYGHEAGDGLLKEVAQRLSTSVRKGDIAGRLGGDEFMVILPQVNDALSAAGIAEHLLARLNKPHRFKDVELAVTPSLGVAIFPDNGDDLDALIRKADRAMYAAKAQGRSCVQLFTPELARRAEDAIALEGGFKTALKRGEFELHYQPIASVDTVEVIGAEALLRWPQEAGRLVPPAEVIPLAESTGLIGELGEWVIRSACEQQMQWRREGLPPLRIAVNISPVQFRQKGFVTTLKRVLGESGIDPAMVQIELTESTVMQDIDKAIEIIQAAHETGVRIAIDNLGTGGGDLGSLSRLPVHTLKIDVSFVRDLETGSRSGAVAQAAVALGRSLKLEIVAEGVESERTLACVRLHQCGLVQGFHVGQPMRAPAFRRWYRERQQSA